MAFAELMTTTQIVVADAANYVQIRLPNRRRVTRFIVISSTATFTVDLYSRLFTGPAVNIRDITSGTGGKALITTLSSVKLAVGDAVTVASSSVGGYNTTHRVTSIVSATSVLTDQNFSAIGTGGTITLAIPSAEFPLYRLLAQLSGTSNLATYFDTTGFYFVDQEPRVKNFAGDLSSNLVLKFSATGTYRIAITSAPIEE